MNYLSKARAFIFDFIGTLTNVKDYSMDVSKKKVHTAISNAGFKVDSSKFLEAYTKAHEKYRKIRYGQLTEVTNSVWIAEALNSLGADVAPTDSRIRIALGEFFEDYLGSFELRPCAEQVLAHTSERGKVGLISNFTHAPVIYAALRRLGVNRFFSVVSVSDAVGWRKPHPRIFEETLRKLGAGPEETVYVGDSPLEDIKGAEALGMKTVFIPSQFYTLQFLHDVQQKPDLIVADLCELNEKLRKL